MCRISGRCNRQNCSRLCVLGVSTFGEGPGESEVDVVLEVCGSVDVVSDGLRCLRPGGLYIFVGMVHPEAVFPLAGELLIRKCLTIIGELPGSCL